MSMIKCPECGKEISNQAEKCPNCGYPVSTKKKSIPLIIIATICGIIAVVVIGSAIIDFSHSKNVGNTAAPSPESKTENILLGNYYLGSEDLHVYVVRFDEDNIVEVVDLGLGLKGDSPKKTYGTYTIDNNAMDINFSGGGSWNCIIHDAGNSITIEGVEFEITPPEKLKDTTLSMFD